MLIWYGDEPTAVRIAENGLKQYARIRIDVRSKVSLYRGISII